MVKLLMIRRLSCVAMQTCRAWIKEEEEGSGEDDVPEEWHLAATMAGCAGVNEMLAELDRRVSALEEVITRLGNALRRKMIAPRDQSLSNHSRRK